MSPINIVMIVLVIVLLFFFIRNSRKRKADQAALQTKMVPGVEVMLSFGVYGKLVSVDDENNTAEVEVADGTVLKVHRQTLGRVVEPVAEGFPEVSDEAVAQAADGPVTSNYSLNEDNAIHLDLEKDRPAPEFGERVDHNPTASHDADKGN